MRKAGMHQIQTMTNQRPRRAAQVVPIEPSLSQRYYVLIVGVFLLLFSIIGFVVMYNGLFGIPSFSGYQTLWTHSFFVNIIPVGIIYPLFALSRLSYWRKLNQRRQQAARYNLMVRASAHAVTSSSSDTTPLPDAFTIESKRNREFTVLWTLVSFFLVCVMGALSYSYWSDTQRAIQQGASMALVIANTAINLVFILAWSLFCIIKLVYGSRQQLVVTRDGLFCCDGYRTRSIPWQEARLFALVSHATTKENEPLFFYELASKDTLIRWPSIDKPAHNTSVASVPSEVTLFGRFIRSSERFPVQIQFLNIIVAERTGLQLYDLRGV